MKRYTLKVDNGDRIENIWSGDDLETALHYEDIAKQAWLTYAEVWVCDNMQELTVG
jgi:hypothetical protein|tara:strand:- start:572 stop:739 length:168 start_codon:yes stop_codon:yes gene_type:complete